MKNTLIKTLSIAATTMIAFAPMTAMADKAPVHGSFSGASNHVTSGGVKVVKTADGGAVVILDSDFSLDGGPDPHVGFGVDGTYIEASDLGDLQDLNGVQVYVVPSSINVDDFNELYIWCKDVGVPLGVAALK
ncbi:MAG: DM13 domain-containing protein [Pseudoruegeria sp.]